MRKLVAVALALLVYGGVLRVAAEPGPAPAAQPQVAQMPVAAAPAREAASPAPQDRGVFAAIVVGAIFAATAFSLLTIRKSLLASTWSLSEALSEDVEMLVEPAAAGAAAAPVKVTRMIASTSRFIAMLGLVAILMMFIGFGMVILYDYALTGVPPTQGSLTPLIYFLTSGLTLFAPYLVNKVAAAVA